MRARWFDDLCVGRNILAITVLLALTLLRLGHPYVSLNTLDRPVHALMYVFMGCLVGAPLLALLIAFPTASHTRPDGRGLVRVMIAMVVSAPLFWAVVAWGQQLALYNYSAKPLMCCMAVIAPLGLATAIRALRTAVDEDDRRRANIQGALLFGAMVAVVALVLPSDRLHVTTPAFGACPVTPEQLRFLSLDWGWRWLAGLLFAAPLAVGSIRGTGAIRWLAVVAIWITVMAALDYRAVQWDGHMASVHYGWSGSPWTQCP